MTNQELLKRLGDIHNAMSDRTIEPRFHRDSIALLINDVDLSPAFGDPPLFPPGGRTITLRFASEEIVEGLDMVAILDRLDAMAKPGDSITVDFGGARPCP